MKIYKAISCNIRNNNFFPGRRRYNSRSTNIRMLRVNHYVIPALLDNTANSCRYCQNCIAGGREGTISTISLTDLSLAVEEISVSGRLTECISITKIFKWNYFAPQINIAACNLSITHSFVACSEARDDTCARPRLASGRHVPRCSSWRTTVRLHPGPDGPTT